MAGVYRPTKTLTLIVVIEIADRSVSQVRMADAQSAVWTRHTGKHCFEKLAPLREASV